MKTLTAHDMDQRIEEAGELLKEVYESGLDLMAYTNPDHEVCQFCGWGPKFSFVSPLNPEEGPHLPSCVWLKIQAWLKEVDESVPSQQGLKPFG